MGDTCRRRLDCEWGRRRNFSLRDREDGSSSQVGRSDWGFTFEGLLGKEWWVSDNWGLGVSAQLLLGSMQESHGTTPFGNPPNWDLFATNVLLTATYN